jgi:uncharacterized protein involved in exopolysaccharide biosynthesis
MTYLIDEQAYAGTMLVAGGMSGLETYDELTRERSARAEAEATAAQLAELIAAEHLRVAAAEREATELRALLDEERRRADHAERELGRVLVNDYSAVTQPTLWERVRHSRARSSS